MFILEETGNNETANKQNDNALPFELNDPANKSVENEPYTKERTRDDIQRLSANLDGYFGNNKPVISAEVSLGKPEDDNKSIFEEAQKPVLTSDDEFKPNK